MRAIFVHTQKQRSQTPKHVLMKGRVYTNISNSPSRIYASKRPSYAVCGIKTRAFWVNIESLYFPFRRKSFSLWSEYKWFHYNVKVERSQYNSIQWLGSVPLQTEEYFVIPAPLASPPCCLPVFWRGLTIYFMLLPLIISCADACTSYNCVWHLSGEFAWEIFRS